MDVERALVTKLVQTQSLWAATGRNIEPYHFAQRRKDDTSTGPTPGEVYTWMVEHLRVYKAVPSPELTRARFKNFEFIDSSDPLEVIVEEMVKTIKRRELIEGIRMLSEVADDPERIGDAEVYVFEVASDLARAVPTSSVTRLSESLDRLALYRRREETGETPGVTMVFPELDDLTYGLQDHELLIYEGFLGIGKSSQAINQCATAYLKQGKSSLFLSLEMEGHKLANKWDAMMSGFSYNALKHLELGEGDLAKWEQFGERAANSKFERDILVIDDIHRCTSDRVFTEIQRWRPDFTVVDTVDELRAPAHIRSNWEQQAWAIRELKGVARTTKKPIIGLAQAGRDAEEQGATLGNIAGSIDIARKADIVIGLHASPDMKRQKMMELRVLKSRDSEGDGKKFTYFWDIANMDFRTWRPTDAIATRA